MPIALEGLPPWARDRRVGHYGGSLDKADSLTEGTTPYAWTVYREMRAARGSAFATVYEGAKSGLVHAENLAIARSEAARWRAADKLRANSEPITSDEKLEAWIEQLGVKRYPADTRHDLRERCATKRQAAVGPTPTAVDDAVRKLLGDVYVRSWRQTGATLAAPPAVTYWPTINPGPGSHSLGGGAWLSERCHLVIETTQPAGMSAARYLELLNLHLFDLLDRMLPAWSTFDWAEGLSDAGGFDLDLDDLDFDGLS